MNISNAESQNKEDNVIEHNEKYFEELSSKNEYLRKRVSELKKKNFNIDKTVRTVEGLDFVYYYNSDKTELGLIQLSKDFHTEVKMFTKDGKTLEKAEFTNDDGQTMIATKDKDGKFNNLSQKNPYYMVRAPWWCKHVMKFVGAGLGALYGSIATAIGGPIAGIIVGLVSSYGWDYVVDMCEE